jgi:hypothetical protein
VGAHGGWIAQRQYPNLWQHGRQRDLRIAVTDIITTYYRDRFSHINAVVDSDTVADTHSLTDRFTDPYTDV